MNNRLHCTASACTAAVLQPVLHSLSLYFPSLYCTSSACTTHPQPVLRVCLSLYCRSSACTVGVPQPVLHSLSLYFGCASACTAHTSYRVECKCKRSQLKFIPVSKTDCPTIDVLKAIHLSALLCICSLFLIQNEHFVVIFQKYISRCRTRYIKNKALRLIKDYNCSCA